MSQSAAGRPNSLSSGLQRIYPMSDVETVKKGIQFAIDYSTGEDKAQLGDPIDVALLQRGHKVQWRYRKSSCYALDAS
jgi:hypothetical protein